MGRKCELPLLTKNQKNNIIVVGSEMITKLNVLAGPSTVIAEFFVRVKISYSCVRGLSYA